jgi:hypothetical protein
MPPSLLLEILLRSDGRILCVVFVVALFVVIGLAKRPSRKCPRCKTLNRPPAEFCAQCGAKLGPP